MAINEDGYKGEKLGFEFFKKLGMKCFQSDLNVMDKDGSYFMVEIKYQEKFKAPPFDGHGLPPYQVKARIDFYNKTGIRCLFLVFDKEDNNAYYQWLDVLESRNKMTTKTGGRVVYDLKSFQVKKI